MLYHQSCGVEEGGRAPIRAVRPEVYAPRCSFYVGEFCNIRSIVWAGTGTVGNVSLPVRRMREGSYSKLTNW